MDWAWLLLSREGRIPRKVYWLYFMLPYIVAALVIGAAEQALGLADEHAILTDQPISLLFLLLMIWPSICVGAKRCHDRNKSAWWMLINFVPLIGALWWLIEFGCLRGTVGPNRFGPDPVEPRTMASPA